MEKWFNLNTDNTLGGEKCSDYVSPSQKAIKEYVDREIAEHAGSYRYTKTLVVTDEESRTVYVSELYDGVEYTDSCIDVSSDGDTEIIVNALPLYKSVFVAVNTNAEETVRFGFDLSDLTYNVLNCRSDCVAAFNRLSVPVLPLGARVVEFYLVGTMMSVRISDIHLDTYSYTPPEYLYFKSRVAGSTVSMTSSLETAPDLEYSADGKHFTPWNSTLSEGVHVFDTITLENINDTVWFRGSNPSGFADMTGAEAAVSFFVFTGSVESGGNIQTIVDRLGDTPSAVCMASMFADYDSSGALVSAPDLPATVLTDNCYAYMFEECSSLAAAPALPAARLAEYCYLGMFAGCSSLTHAADLPASSLEAGCYAYMYQYCTFAMSDDCTAFNFRHGLTFPCGDGTEVFETPYDLAVWMGNTEGFCETYEKYAPAVFAGEGCFTGSPCAVVADDGTVSLMCGIYGDFTGDEVVSALIGDVVFECSLYSEEITEEYAEQMSVFKSMFDCAAMDEYADCFIHYTGHCLVTVEGRAEGAAGIPAAGTAEILVDGVAYAEVPYKLYNDYEAFVEDMVCCEMNHYAPRNPNEDLCFMNAPAYMMDTGSGVQIVVACVFGDFEQGTRFRMKTGDNVSAATSPVVSPTSDIAEHYSAYEGLVDGACYNANIFPLLMLCDVYSMYAVVMTTASGLPAEDGTVLVYAGDSEEPLASVPYKYYENNEALEADMVCCEPLKYMPYTTFNAVPGCAYTSPCVVTHSADAGYMATAALFGNFTADDEVTLSAGGSVFTVTDKIASSVDEDAVSAYRTLADSLDECNGDNPYRKMADMLEAHEGGMLVTFVWASPTFDGGSGGEATVYVNGTEYTGIPYKFYSGEEGDDPSDGIVCCSFKDYLPELWAENCVLRAPAAAILSGDGTVVSVQVFGDYGGLDDPVFTMSREGESSVSVEANGISVDSAASAITELMETLGGCAEAKLFPVFMSVSAHASAGTIYSLEGLFESEFPEGGEIDVTMPDGTVISGIPYTLYESMEAAEEAFECCGVPDHSPYMWDGAGCTWGTPAIVTKSGESGSEVYTLECILFGNISGVLSARCGQIQFNVSAGSPVAVTQDYADSAQSLYSALGAGESRFGAVLSVLSDHIGENMYRVTGTASSRPDAFKRISFYVDGQEYDSVDFALYESSSDRAGGCNCLTGDGFVPVVPDFGDDRYLYEGKCYSLYDETYDGWRMHFALIADTAHASSSDVSVTLDGSQLQVNGVFTENITQQYVDTLRAKISSMGSCGARYMYFADYLQANLGRVLHRVIATKWNVQGTLPDGEISVSLAGEDYGTAGFGAFSTEEALRAAEACCRYSITASVAEGQEGMGSVSGGGTYVHDDLVTLTASANDNYSFKGWLPSGGSYPRLTFRATGDADYTAEFEPVMYVITVDDDQSEGKRGDGTGAGSYRYGSQAQIGAAPYSGYRFARWSDGNTDNPRTVTVTGDATYTVVFEPVDLTVTPVVKEGQEDMGSVSGGGVCKYGADTTVTATPNTGYVFDAWSGMYGRSTDNPRTFQVLFSGTITAEFARQTLQVDCSSNNENWGTVNGTHGVVYYGTDCTFAAIPKAGYVFVEWSDGNTEANRTVTIVADTNLVATFAPAGRTVSVSSNDSSLGTVSGGGTYPDGTSVTLTATPAQGCSFLGWSDGVDSAVRTITVSGNFSAVAWFDNRDAARNLNFTMPEGGTVTLSGEPSGSRGLEYSTDGGSTWTEWVKSGQTRTLSVQDGQTVHVRSRSVTSTGVSSLFQFSFEGAVNAAGSVSSLLCRIPENAELSAQCLGMLFRNCTSLLTPPALPATTLATRCYYGMFYGCTALTSAPDLPATTLAQGCYGQMFRGCTALATPPRMSATTLAESCCEEMFYGCTALTAAPYLPARVLARMCYSNMFNSCSSLAAVTCLATDISASGCVNFWLYGVADSGVFTKHPDMDNWPAGSPSGIPQGWTPSDDYGIYLNFTMPNGGDVTLTKTGSPTEVTLEYRMDGDDSWTTWAESGNVRTLALGAGQTAYIRNASSTGTGFSTSDSNYYKFGFTGGVSASGNVMSLLSNEPANGAPISSYCFSHLFEGCTFLTSAPALPATTLAYDCYYSMFRGCTALTTAPELPATTLAGSCYQSMFRGCTSLTAAPALPATTLVGGCYESMFYGCTALTAAPALPATALDSYCYWSMFSLCTSLASAPALPAMTMALDCYNHMFYGCTSLAAAPALPATTMAFGCYDGMFLGCTSLTAAPELPATTLARQCYDSMFKDCTALTTAPTLPVTTLMYGCYYGMFEGCTALTAAPALPATTLAERCYEYMFSGCTLLSSITCMATDISATNCTNDWLSGVASDGVFTKNTAMSNWTIGTSGIPSGWTVQDEYLNFTMPNGGDITLTKNGTPTEVTLEYRVGNSGSWTTWTESENVRTLTLSAGQTAYIRNTSPTVTGFSTSDSNYYRFSFTHTVSASGSVMSLLSINPLNAGMSNYCFITLFYGCRSLTTAPALPATTLADSCYYGMFFGCTSLTSAPALPAMTLAYSCYWRMFSGCTSLTSAQTLPATTLADDCYGYMFYGCRSLTTAPALPATTLADSCYYGMFYGCTSLTSAPALPATTLTDSCYENMFRDCTALTAAIELPATMLSGSCYSGMFYGCTLLSSVVCMATDISASYCTYDWLFGVAASGTFTKNASMSNWTTGQDGIPSGWTVVDAQ